MSYYTEVRLQNFRSYKEKKAKLAAGINIVVGPNASGKTNLLESLYALNRFGSFRSSERYLIKDDEEWARVDGKRQDGDERTLTVEQKDNRTPLKNLRINDQIKKRVRQEYLLPTVLFEPEHLHLLHGSPEGRRNYLDTIIIQSQPSYSSTLSQYKRALSQRNKLLKKQPPGWRDHLFAWDVRLSDLGTIIVQKRTELVDELNQQTSETYSKISSKPSQLTISYVSKLASASYQSKSLQALQQSVDSDSIKGFTGIGPHRDDLFFELDGRSAHEEASRGEIRSIVITAKIIEISLLQKVNNQSPLVLLDDVFSELDSSRRQALTKQLENIQTIITTTDADVITKGLKKGFKLIKTN